MDRGSTQQSNIQFNQNFIMGMLQQVYSSITNRQNLKNGMESIECGPQKYHPNHCSFKRTSYQTIRKAQANLFRHRLACSILLLTYIHCCATSQNHQQYLNKMSKKKASFSLDGESLSRAVSSLPQTLELKAMSGNSGLDIISLRVRVEELESKVEQLEARVRSKRKRIRRKSSEVEKKYKCDFCRKLYGSLVSLNLHLRIKHKREKQDRDEAEAKQHTEQPI